MSQAFPAEDGNFKRGAVRPIAIVVALLLVAGAAVAAVLSIHGETQSMTKEAVTKEILDIQLLPRADQIPRWRTWAASESEARLRQRRSCGSRGSRTRRASRDDLGGLSATDHAVQGTAAMALASFRDARGRLGQAALLKALAEADSSDKPQEAWALAALHRADGVRRDHGRIPPRVTWRPVTRLDAASPGLRRRAAGVARATRQVGFDGQRRERQCSAARRHDALPLRRRALDHPAHQARARQDRSRSRERRPVGLRQDRQRGRGRGPGRRAEQGRQALEEKFLQALRDVMGAPGLVLALQTVQHTTPESEKFQTKQIFDMLKELEDPRAAPTRSTRVHPERAEAALEGRGGDAHGRDRRRPRGRGPRLAHAAGPAQALQRRRLARAPSRRQRARLRRAHARRPGRPAPRAARHAPQDRRAGRPLLGRPGQQASAARERDALPRGGGLDQEHLDALRGLVRPEGRKLPNEGAQPALPRRRGRRRGGALRYLGWTQGSRARLADPREAAPPEEQEARRVRGTPSMQGRAHDPRDDPPGPSASGRPTASRSGATRAPTTTS